MVFACLMLKREFHDSAAKRENEHQSVKEPHHALAWALPQHTVTDTTKNTKATLKLITVGSTAQPCRRWLSSGKVSFQIVRGKGFPLRDGGGGGGGTVGEGTIKNAIPTPLG